MIDHLLKAPRCGARSKRTGKPCKGPAMANGRCYYHGGASTGPRTEAGINRIKEANTKHGYYTAQAKADRQEMRRLIRELAQKTCEIRINATFS